MVQRLNHSISGVGADAAAMAALHPLDFNPEDKWDIAAAYGNCGDANATAIGAFYRPNEDTMISFGGSFGTNHNMVNVGVAVKVGSGNRQKGSRVGMMKQLAEQNKKIARLEAQEAMYTSVLNTMRRTEQEHEALIMELRKALQGLEKNKSLCKTEVLKKDSLSIAYRHSGGDF